MTLEARLRTIANEIIAASPRFVRCGRTLSELDCLGLCLLVYSRLGLRLPDPCSYSAREVTAHPVMRHFAPCDKPRPGAALWIDGDPEAGGHVGILISATEVLQMTHSHGAVVLPLRRFDRPRLLMPIWDLQ